MGVLPKKFSHSLSPLTAILFVVALDDFDLFNAPNTKGNALRHSLRSFAHIANDKLFRKTPIKIVFEKRSEFEHKIASQSRSLSLCFEDYIDDSDVERNVQKSLRFVRGKFVRAIEHRSSTRGIYLSFVEHFGDSAEHLTQIKIDTQHIKVPANLDFGGL